MLRGIAYAPRMNASSFASSFTTALIATSMLTACGGGREGTPDVLDGSVLDASDGSVVDTTDAAATDPDVASSDDGVPSRTVNVAYLGIVGEARPYAILLQRDGHIRYRVTHLSSECTMVNGTYGTDVSDVVAGALRVSDGARYYTFDFETGERTMDLGGGAFAAAGDPVVFETMGRGTVRPFPTTMAHLRRPPVIALLATTADSVIDRTQPLTLQWTPPADSTGITIHVGMFTMGDTGQNELWCDFAAASGAATIPATVLSQFPEGTGDISINAHSGEVADIDGWHVRTSYFNDALLPGAHTSYYGMVTYR